MFSSLSWPSLFIFLQWDDMMRSEASSLLRCPHLSVVCSSLASCSHDVSPGGPRLCHCLWPIVLATWGYVGDICGAMHCIVVPVLVISGHLWTQTLNEIWPLGQFIQLTQRKWNAIYFNQQSLKVSRYSWVLSYREKAEVELWWELVITEMGLLTSDSLGADVSQLCDPDVCIDIPLKLKGAVIAPTLMIHSQFPGGNLWRCVVSESLCYNYLWNL